MPEVSPTHDSQPADVYGNREVSIIDKRLSVFINLNSMVAVLEIGAFSERYDAKRVSLLIHPVTSLLAAPLADNYGRRLTLRLGACIFCIGGACQTFCTSYTIMVIGRIISGFGVGMLSMVVPIYQVSWT
jgi:hypothetical protein